MFFPSRAFASLLLTACNHPTHATTIPPNPRITTHATTHHPPPTYPTIPPTLCTPYNMHQPPWMHRCYMHHSWRDRILPRSHARKPQTVGSRIGSLKTNEFRFHYVGPSQCNEVLFFFRRFGQQAVPKFGPSEPRKIHSLT